MSLPRAIDAYIAGRLDEAERMLGEHLRADPDHVDALHILAMVAYQTGRMDYAAELVTRVIELNPRRGDVHNTHGLIEAARGRLAEAEAALRSAAACDPDNPVFRVNLALQLHSGGKLDDAVETLRSVTE